METKPRQIEFINEDIDNTIEVIFRDLESGPINWLEAGLPA